MMDRIIVAITDHSAGRRERFRALWEEIGENGDPLHRCTLSHYAADEEPDPADALLWNQRSLSAAGALTDARLRTTFPDLTVAGFRPSLHLNLAQDWFKLGDFAAATRHLDAAMTDLPALGEDGYGAMVRRGIERLREEMAG